MKLHRVLVLTCSLLCASIANAQEWQPVRGGLSRGISGMALVSQSAGASKFLVVHDNKLPTEARAAMVETSPDSASRYTPLSWAAADKALPIDLEALCAVPQKSGEFLALTSNGGGFHIRFNESMNAVDVLKTFTLPAVVAGNNFESFDLKQIGGALVAFWAHRGNGAVPATLSWARLNLRTLEFSDTQSTTFSAPFPVATPTSSTHDSNEIRHVSDLRVDGSGVLYVSSASDAGDDGPYTSALYIAGTFFRVGNAIQFEQSVAPVVLRRFKYRKIESLELLPGADGIVVGTDDENMGSSIYFTAQ